MNAHVSRVNKATALAGLLLLSAPAVSNAAELTNETLQAWQDYIQNANSRMQERIHGGAPFLWADESTERSRQVLAGEVLVAPMGEHSPIRVSKGLIHDWIGAALIPNATLDDIFAVVRDYDRYKEFYMPLVVDSKLLGGADTDYRFSLLMLNKSLFSKKALVSEWNDTYVRVNDRQWYSVAYSTHVQEIEGYGTPGERKLPPDAGSGYIWRLYSFSRFEQREGGVYVELEVIALSREIPAALRWFIDPIVRRVSRGSLFTSLMETRAAVSSQVSASNKVPHPTASRDQLFVPEEVHSFTDRR
jgi:hypothetical protein